MKKLLSVFLSVVMLFCALPVFVSARGGNQQPWKDYENYLYYNNSYQKNETGYVTNGFTIKFASYFFDDNHYWPQASDFGEFASRVYYVDYDEENGVYIVRINEDNLEIDGNGCPVYTKEWLDTFISGLTSLYSETYILDVFPNTAEYLKPLKLSRTLSYGCKGDDVKTAQRYLNKYGYLKAKPDGIFGAMTEAAVLLFQSCNGLANPDGKIGNWTAGKLNSGDVEYFFPLSWGVRNNTVKLMQTYLKKLGYLSATPDGIFGSKTETALVDFMEHHGFNPTGEADFEVISAILNRNTKNKSYYQLSLSRTLKYGDRGDDVKKVQAKLNDLGYLPVNPDGIYGAKTEAAVIIFQAFNGLANPDGKVGGWTVSKLNNRPSSFVRIMNGVHGTSVLVLQKYLAKLNYMKNLSFSNNKPVYTDIKPDGKFGNFTEQAVMLFQYNNDICWHGVVTIDTYLAIVNRNTKARVLDGKKTEIPDISWYNITHYGFY